MRADRRLRVGWRGFFSGRDRAEILLERGHEFTAPFRIDAERDGRREDLQVEKFLVGSFALASLIPDFELGQAELGNLRRREVVTKSNRGR